MTTSATRSTEILLKACYILLAPDNWTQNANARKADGQSTFSFDPDAVSWCLGGALNRVIGFTPASATAHHDAVERVRRVVGDIENYNDAPDRTFDDIKLVLKAALE